MATESISERFGSDSAFTSDHVEFVGFSEKRVKKLRALLEKCGLPLTNLMGVSQKNVYYGTATHDSSNGEMLLPRQFWYIGDSERKKTIVHELGHDLSPFNADSNTAYGSEENRMRTSTHVRAIAKQSLLTNRYLNPYHKKRAESCVKFPARMSMASEIQEALMRTFEEETHAILIELRYTNKKHLQQVEAAQKKRMRKLSRASEFTPILTPPESEPLGVDATLIDLMGDDVKTVTDIDQKARAYFNSGRTFLGRLFGKHIDRRV